MLPPSSMAKPRAAANNKRSTIIDSSSVESTVPVLRALADVSVVEILMNSVLLVPMRSLRIPPVDLERPVATVISRRETFVSFEQFDGCCFAFNSRFCTAL